MIATGINVPLPNPKDGTLVHIRYDNMKASHSSTFGKTKVSHPLPVLNGTCLILVPFNDV